MRLTSEAKTLLKEIIKWSLFLLIVCGVAYLLVIGIVNQKHKSNIIKSDTIRIETQKDYEYYKRTADSLDAVNNKLIAEIVNLKSDINKLVKEQNEKADYFTDVTNSIDSAELYIANRIKEYRQNHLLSRQ